MNKEWVAQREAEHEKAISEMRESITSKIEATDLLSAEKKAEVLDCLSKMEENYWIGDRIDFELTLLALGQDGILYKKIKDFNHDLDIAKYQNMLKTRGGYSRYLDSEPKKFDGDIIITDPCYVRKHRDESSRPQWNDYMKKDHYGTTDEERRANGFYDDYEKLKKADAEWEENNPDDWDTCDYGYNMEALGINTYMTRDTLYGDWSCTTYDSDTKEELGHFCADAGLVSVFLLDEILNYNPEFDYHKERTWTTTLIPNFNGTVQFMVEREEGFYKEDTKWWKAGDKWVDYAVKVVGHGVNKITGEPINFITSQTGL